MNAADWWRIGYGNDFARNIEKIADSMEKLADSLAKLAASLDRIEKLLSDELAEDEVPSDH